MKIRKIEGAAVKAALDTIDQYGMLQEGDSVLISVSGGPDSVFLTHVLVMLGQEMDLRLYGFSLDHVTREGQSARDLEFVRRLYRDLDLELFTRRIDAAGWSRRHKMSFQEGARRLRADILAEIAEDRDIKKIALGHNLDDNIETFLMRLIRGSGARGLSGIDPVSGRYIRPLINTARKDIEACLRTGDIPYCTDLSNWEDSYTRNRIRNRLIPYIEENFTGDLKKSVRRCMEILRDEDVFLRKYSRDIMEKNWEHETDRENNRVIHIKIPVEVFDGKPIAVCRRMIQAALEDMTGNLEEISYNNIEDILDMVLAGTGENRFLMLPGKLVVFRIKDHIHLADTAGEYGLDPGLRSYIMDRTQKEIKTALIPHQEILIGGETDIAGTCYSARTSISDDPGDYGRLPGSITVLDFDRLALPLMVRSWQRGDRFEPLGMKGSRKLQDFFMDNKIPVDMRKKIPVFHDREKIIRVGNMRIDRRVKIKPSTSSFLRLELFEK